MFTGLVEETARVTALEGTRLSLAAQRVLEGTRVGDSIAVNGCCLTVTAMTGEGLTFDLLAETLARTNLGALRPGSLVNLERALAVGERLGGHVVQGHIDETAEILRLEQEPGGDTRLTIALSPASGRYVVFKGSIAVDGISLTVAQVDPGSFTLCIIPHTLAQTHLHRARPGDRVNLEFDLLAKYVERLLRVSA